MRYKKPLTATDIINQSCSTPEEEANFKDFIDIYLEINRSLIDHVYDVMVRDGLIEDAIKGR